MDKEFLFIPLLLAFWFWVVWFIVTTTRRHKVTRMHAQLREKLLDKLGSSPEVLDFLKTDAGAQFLQPLASEQRTPQGRIVGALELSVVLVLLGAALLFLGRSGAATGPGFFVFGTLILALGIGFALAGAVSYLASKSLGLLNGTTGRRG